MLFGCLFVLLLSPTPTKANSNLTLTLLSSLWVAISQQAEALITVDLKFAEILPRVSQCNKATPIQ